MITLSEIAYNVRNNLDEVLLAIVFTVYSGNIFNRSRLVLKVVVSEHSFEAQCPRACGGNNKMNRILKVSILFPYLLVEHCFSVRNNQCCELELIVNAFWGISDFPEKINKGVKQSMSIDLWVTTTSSTSRLLTLLQSYNG